LAISEFCRVGKLVSMISKTTWWKKCAAAACLLLIALLGGCGKPSPEAPRQQASPAVGQPAQPAPTQPQAGADEGLSGVAVRILNAAHRSGGIVLEGGCTARGLDEKYTAQLPAHAEALEPALRELSAQHQNIYWRESPASGVRVVDSTARARLLSLRIREFRVVEDLEPDAVMAVLWREPEVKSFLRQNHASFVRREYGARKVLSPPMILEAKRRTVAEVLDRIAAAYHRNPPRVWVYQECTENGSTLMDVRMP
jgi:hypothetical protein